MGKRTDTRQRMIDAAKVSYRHHGVTATGFTEVLERAGATRGTTTTTSRAAKRNWPLPW